jgi:hypothetical protein
VKACSRKLTDFAVTRSETGEQLVATNVVCVLAIFTYSVIVW